MMNVIKVIERATLYDPTVVTLGATASELMEGFNTSKTIPPLIEQDAWVGTILQPEISRKIESYINIELPYVAFKIKDIWQEKDKIIGHIEILDTEAGRFFKECHSGYCFVPRALVNPDDGKCLLITFDVRPRVFIPKK